MTPTSPTATGPRCFECGYSLRGLTENRCPECGFEFNPHDFLPLKHEDLWRSNPWERAPTIRSWVVSFAASMFRPDSLFRNYRGHYDDIRSFSYSGLCHAISAGIIIACSAWISPGAGVFTGVVMAGFASIGACLIQSFVSGIMARCLTTPPGHSATEYWRPHERYLSSFFVMLSAALVNQVLMSRNPSYSNLQLLGAELISIGVLIWGLVALGIAATRGSTQRPIRVGLTLVLIGAIAIVSIAAYSVILSIGIKIIDGANC